MIAINKTINFNFLKNIQKCTVKEKVKWPQNKNFQQNYYGKDAEFSADSGFVEMGSQKGSVGKL